MKSLFLVVFTFSLNLVYSQLQFEKLNHDFGNLTNSSERFFDIEVKNSGIKKEYFLSFRNPKDVVTLSKGEFVLPDSTSFIRVQVNPKNKGKFNYEVQIFTSDKNEATLLKVSGNFTEKPENELAQYQSCPNFSIRPAGRNPVNKITIKTIDAITKLPVDAKVYLIQNGTDVSQITTKNGNYTGKIPLGFTYFLVNAESYIKLDTNAYVNLNRNEIILELKKDPSYTKIIPQEKDVTEVKKEIKVSEKTKEKEPILDMRKELKEELSSIPTTKTDSLENVSLNEIPLSNFDDHYFKPINVVFVLDISSSMGREEKFDLMKFSLVELLDILRPQDKISLVTYATEAKVLLESSKGNEKDKILAEIKKLKASGQTAGVEGIKLGFKEAEKNFISEGSNIVIVVTDGAFNKNGEDYLKLIEKQYLKNKIQFSVVGIKNLPYHEKNLVEAAQNGNGAYVPVFKLADAQQNLIREIKRVSFKTH